jgi:hypothetical protein
MVVGVLELISKGARLSNRQLAGVQPLHFRGIHPLQMILEVYDIDGIRQRADWSALPGASVAANSLPNFGERLELRCYDRVTKVKRLRDSPSRYLIPSPLPQFKHDASLF